MVAMGRALMMEPSVLLLDEPSAGLSPVMQDEVFVQTRRINRAGVSVVMVEQNASRCLQICDRGYVLDQGRNAYTGTGKDLAKDPKVIELYLGTLAKALTRRSAEPVDRRDSDTRKGPAEGRALSTVLSSVSDHVARRHDAGDRVDLLVGVVATAVLVMPIVPAERLPVSVMSAGPLLPS